MTTQIELGDITVDVVLKDIKNIHLSVYPPAGRVRISAPLRWISILFAFSPFPGWAGSNSSRKNSGNRSVKLRVNIWTLKAITCGGSVICSS